MSIDGGALLGDRYALGEVIGRGGMADVYRGHDRLLDRPVAIKVLREGGAGESDRARFAAEARTLARLNHPGVVTLIDAGSSSSHQFLVMQLVEGETLAERLRTGPLAEGLVAGIGRQLAQALAYAHAAGVIHRDVKPANVLLGGDGRAQLTDFGVARLVDQATHHTRPGMAIGSPAYLAPEQISGAEVGTGADVYSLGLVLLESLTGRREYAGPSLEAALARLTRPPVVPAELPGAWRTLLTAMTALDPAERPTAAQVAAAIPGPLAQTVPLAEQTQVLPVADLTTAPRTERLPSAFEAAGDWLGSAFGAVRDRLPSAIGAVRDWPGWDHARRRLRPLLRDRVAAIAVLGMCLLGVLLFALALASDDPAPPPSPRVPDGVPAELREPLADLHDAVHGRAE